MAAQLLRELGCLRFDAYLGGGRISQVWLELGIEDVI